MSKEGKIVAGKWRCSKTALIEKWLMHSSIVHSLEAEKNVRTRSECKLHRLNEEIDRNSLLANLLCPT
jgi:hypothetical protein